MSGLFNVYYDGINWIGVVLEERDGLVRAGRYIFGAEPSPNEIFEWARRGCPGLILSEVSPNGMQGAGISMPKANPKRLQKEARRAMENKPIGSYAEAQLKIALEGKKKVAAISSRERRALAAEERFLKKTLKKKKQRRGH